METSRVVLVLVCVVFCSQKRIFGVNVEMRVRRGDNITLYSDCEIKVGFNIVWFRTCSHQNQPPLMISLSNLPKDGSSRYLFLFNESTNTHNLLIKNITESEEAVYTCALHERIILKDKDGIIIRRDVYHYGNRSTRLSVLETSPCAPVSPHTPTPCVSEQSVKWTLMLSVCAVCILVSSLLSSICVYCLCTHTTKAKLKTDLTGSDKRITGRHDEVGGDEVCYAALDIPNVENKMKRKKRRVQDCDFSTYSEVTMERTEWC